MNKKLKIMLKLLGNVASLYLDNKRLHQKESEGGL